MLANTLKLTSLALAMANMALAGNVCLGTALDTSFGGGAPEFGAVVDRYQLAFAAGSPCDNSRSATLNDGLSETWCKVINRTPEFEMCGKKATLVNKGPGVGHGNDCGAVLSIDSVEYEGRNIGEDEENPCGGECDAGIAFGSISGLKIFEGVPMC